MASLRAEHIVKKFGKQTALNDVSFEIEDGEFVCVLGPSGCGKSTLLRVVAGLEDIESGKVEIGGRDVTGEPPSARNFGIVFQSYALFPNMTAEENIAYGLWNKRLSREETALRVNGAIEMVGLEEQRKKYPQQLSGGQQQRVAIARAIVLKPEFLLLDEPLSALDAKVRVKLRRELRHIQQKLGITTIMVTHDQEEALSLADRVIVMNNSVIEQIDTPQKVYESPSSPFVADFVGTVNFVGGRSGAIRPESLRLCRAGHDGAIPGRICDIEFRGSFYRVGVETAGGEYTADVPAQQRENLPLRFGALVYLDIPAEKVICLKAS
ncbi:ATP-binding cassette domain-containing protein [Cloacibacillus sp. An23]|uniref:ABC transporter ATP-binding protein n=1 Tax=Cloacibacillus sp. An23 TaxID=1965591 RepID=UPI000B390F28|nr:ATP-binding cassette domain-containing protein [Cloacibacillus sp. An23]OUO93347.1 phosphonate ABC transporter ATP-binding protein [Cloacibacillus sp. An23]